MKIDSPEILTIAEATAKVEAARANFEAAKQKEIAAREKRATAEHKFDFAQAWVRQEWNLGRRRAYARRVEGLAVSLAYIYRAELLSAESALARANAAA